MITMAPKRTYQKKNYSQQFFFFSNEEANDSKRGIRTTRLSTAHCAQSGQRKALHASHLGLPDTIAFSRPKPDKASSVLILWPQIDFAKSSQNSDNMCSHVFPLNDVTHWRWTAGGGTVLVTPNELLSAEAAATKGGSTSRVSPKAAGTLRLGSNTHASVAHSFLAFLADGKDAANSAQELFSRPGAERNALCTAQIAADFVHVDWLVFEAS